MTKEKTIVCIGIILVLAVLTSCALYYSTNSYPNVSGGSMDNRCVTMAQEVSVQTEAQTDSVAAVTTASEL